MAAQDAEKVAQDARDERDQARENSVKCSCEQAKAERAAQDACKEAEKSNREREKAEKEAQEARVERDEAREYAIRSACKQVTAERAAHDAQSALKVAEDAVKGALAAEQLATARLESLVSLHTTELEDLARAHSAELGDLRSKLRDAEDMTRYAAIGKKIPKVFITMADRYIPTDILFNILVRLPATSLQRLKYASKQWFSTISDPDFAEAHFAHQSQEEFGYNVLVSLNKDDIFIGERLTSNPNPPQRMNLPGVHGRVCIYNACKGLVLFRCGTSLHIANPITGDWLSLPQFYGYGSIFSASIGCGCDTIFSANIGCGCDGKLKVVVVGRRSRNILKSPLICGILTPGSRSWRELHIPVIESLLEPSRAGGSLHWIYETGLLSLDLGEEKFHQTEVTFCDYSQLRYHSCDLEWDGCFAIFIRQLLTNRYYCGWVLKKSGWMKLPDVDVAFYQHIGLPLIENGPIGHPLMENGPILATSARYGEMILFLQVVGGCMQLFAYDMGRGTVTKFTEFDSNFSLPYLEQGRFAITTHVNSMISCSSLDFPKKGGVCFSVKKFLAYLASTLSHLFKVCFSARFLAYLASTLNNLFKS